MKYLALVCFAVSTITAFGHHSHNTDRELRGAGGGGSSSAAGGIADQSKIDALLEYDGPTNSKLAMWDPMKPVSEGGQGIDQLTEILGVIAGIIGYLILIWTLSFAYGKYQDSQNNVQN